MIALLKFKERRPASSAQAHKSMVKDYDQPYKDVKVQSTVFFGTKSRDGTMSNLDKADFDGDKEQKQ